MMMMVVVVVMTTMTMMIAETPNPKPQKLALQFPAGQLWAPDFSSSGRFWSVQQPHQLALCLKRTPNRKKAEFKERELKRRPNLRLKPESLEPGSGQPNLLPLCPKLYTQHTVENSNSRTLKC